MHRVTAKFLFLATRARQDILVVVNHLSSKVNKYTKSDIEKVNHCLKYLNKTREEGLTLETTIFNEKLKLSNMTDASYATREKAKSQSRTTTTLGKGSIYDPQDKKNCSISK
jgi:hypothetical protein